VSFGHLEPEIKSRLCHSFGEYGNCTRTALGGVTSLSRKCSSLQQEVRVFSKWHTKKNWNTHAALDNEKMIGQNTYLLSIILGL
jgi:hypothetical protein